MQINSSRTEAQAAHDAQPYVQPTYRQVGLILTLARLLGIEAPRAEGPYAAGLVIDELRVLCELDPDIVPCAAEGCDRLVNRRRPRAHTFCSRHRGGAS